MSRLIAKVRPRSSDARAFFAERRGFPLIGAGITVIGAMNVASAIATLWPL